MVLINCPQRRPIVLQLSYTNPSVILEIVESPRAASQIPDDELLRRVSTFLLTHHADVGIEHALTSDEIIVNKRLRMSRMPEVETASRATLRYLLQEDGFIHDTMPALGLQEDACALVLALQEMAGLTGFFSQSARFSLVALAGQLGTPPIRLAIFVAIRAIGSPSRAGGLEHGPQPIARIIAAILAGVN